MWLEIGTLAQVEREALRFCFDAVTRGGVADGARLEIVDAPGRRWCMPCGERVPIAAIGDACPRCGSYQLQVVAGDDMRVQGNRDRVNADRRVAGGTARRTTMCTTCGCGSGETRIDGVGAGTSTSTHADGTTHAHARRHTSTRMRTTHVHGTDARSTRTHAGEHAHRATARRGRWHATPRRRHATAPRRTPAPAPLGAAHAPGMPRRAWCRSSRTSSPRTTPTRARNRAWLADRGIFALNLVSSPGSGKTTLLVRTIEALHGRARRGGDRGRPADPHDADRIRATGAPAMQINTGKGCHLDAHMVGHALRAAARSPTTACC